MIATTPGMVRERLRFERAALLQRGDLPPAAAVYRFALQLEVLRRIEQAEAEGDRTRLAELLTTAGRWGDDAVSSPSTPPRTAELLARARLVRPVADLRPGEL